MKINVVLWAAEGKEKLEALGIKREPGKVEIPIETEDIWSLAKKLYDGGLNVMVVHSEKQDAKVFIGVDTRTFGQR